MFRLLLLLLVPALVVAADRPNVLFIMADDYRTEVGCYGSPALTPNLDRLAKRAVAFDRAYCQQAVCNPSRSSMLTGLRPDATRVWSNSMHFRTQNPDVVTLPQYFKQHGYESRCCGKIFHNWHTEVHGDPQSWSAPEFLHYANHGDDLPQVTGALPPNLATECQWKYGNTSITECRDVPDEAYYDGRVAAEAVRVLGEVKDKPFFLAVGFWKPHAPFNAPKKYWDLYSPSPSSSPSPSPSSSSSVSSSSSSSPTDKHSIPPLNPARPEGAPDIAFHQSTEVLGPVKDQKPLTPAQIAEMRQGYFANIAYMDAQLGKVLDALDRSGVADRTLIVFVADHGYHIGEHTLWGKTSNFEYDAHPPLLISKPGAKANGQHTESLVELVDLFPTVVAATGLPLPSGLAGTSLLPILDDSAAKVKPAAFTQHPRPAYYDRTPTGQPEVMGCSVRTDRVRYTEWRDWKTGKVVARELYAHPGDEQELKNAIDQPSLAEAQREAAELLAKNFPAPRP